MHRNYPGGVYYSVYESGFCGFWIHRQLQQYGFKNIVVNAADVPTTHKEKVSKTDKVDSNKLSRELANGQLSPIYIPDEFHQQLCSLNRLRNRIVQNCTRVKNRIKSYLYLSGVSIPLHSELSHWSNNFLKWLSSLDFFYQPAKDYIDICLEELQGHRSRLVRVLRLLRKYCNEYKLDIIEYLRTVPGVGFITAITLYTEIIDMARFADLDHLVSYVGLIPTLHSSGEKSCDGNLTSRRNGYLRHVLIEAAWVAVRKDAALLQSFKQLTRRMKKQDAIIRIAKKLLGRIRYVWKNKKPYIKLLV